MKKVEEEQENRKTNLKKIQNLTLENIQLKQKNEALRIREQLLNRKVRQLEIMFSPKGEIGKSLQVFIDNPQVSSLADQFECISDHFKTIKEFKIRYDFSSNISVDQVQC